MAVKPQLLFATFYFLRINALGWNHRFKHCRRIVEPHDPYGIPNRESPKKIDSIVVSLIR